VLGKEHRKNTRPTKDQGRMSAGTTNVKMLRGLGGTEYVHADLRQHRFPLHFHDTFVIEQVTPNGLSIELSTLIANCSANSPVSHRMMFHQESI